MPSRAASGLRSRRAGFPCPDRIKVVREPDKIEATDRYSVGAPMKILHGNKLEILGASKIIYRNDEPLSSGAQVWIETESAVILDGKMLP